MSVYCNVKDINYFLQSREEDIENGSNLQNKIAYGVFSTNWFWFAAIIKKFLKIDTAPNFV